MYMGSVSFGTPWGPPVPGFRQSRGEAAELGLVGSELSGHPAEPAGYHAAPLLSVPVGLFGNEWRINRQAYLRALEPAMLPGYVNFSYFFFKKYEFWAIFGPGALDGSFGLLPQESLGTHPMCSWGHARCCEGHPRVSGGTPHVLLRPW